MDEEQGFDGVRERMRVLREEVTSFAGKVSRLTAAIDELTQHVAELKQRTELLCANARDDDAEPGNCPPAGLRTR